MRRSSYFLFYLAISLLLLIGMCVHASLRQRAGTVALKEKSEMVGKIEITDLCLFTEASYTRHLSQADLHTPFQDGPSSLEHFPSGAIVSPPTIIRRINEKLD